MTVVPDGVAGPCRVEDWTIVLPQANDGGQLISVDVDETWTRPAVLVLVAVDTKHVVAGASPAARTQVAEACTGASARSREHDRSDAPS